ncbi:MAG: hypothetical protein LUH10_07840 [Tannerellaceae bacterium]|nr:hypothetical protein [Tannerellaceae bacterium]
MKLQLHVRQEPHSYQRRSEDATPNKVILYRWRRFTSVPKLVAKNNFSFFILRFSFICLTFAAGF